MRSLITATGKVIELPDLPVKKKEKPYGKIVFVRNSKTESWRCGYLRDIFMEKEKPYLISRNLNDTVWEWEAFKYCEVCEN